MTERHMLRATLPTLICCALLAACAPARPGAGDSRPTPDRSPPLAAGTQPTAVAAAGPGLAPEVEPEIEPEIDPANPCLRADVGEQADSQPAAGAIEARYDGGENTIVLSAGEAVTLPALSRAIDNPAVLRELAPGEWLLGATLEILTGASLRIAGPEARWLKLRSDAGGFAALKVLGGELDVAGACITSWDEARGRADEELRDGRGFVLARDGAQMRIAGAELRFLGYDADESFGLAWRLEETGGSLTGSAVSHNFYGLYSYEVSGLVIQDNEVHHNLLYGIDPHTRSHRLLIERNVVHSNGKHGIILADACADGVVRDNIVFNNLHHGIVLYQNSDRNLVEGNRSFGNGAQGINLNQAADNIVRANQVYENLEAGIGVGQRARDNLLVGNEVHANGEDGIRLYSDAAETTIRANQIGDNGRYGVYVDSDGGAHLAGNTIFGSRTGVLLKGEASVSPGDNRLYNNSEADIAHG